MSIVAKLTTKLQRRIWSPSPSLATFHPEQCQPQSVCMKLVTPSLKRPRFSIAQIFNNSDSRSHNVKNTRGELFIPMSTKSLPLMVIPSALCPVIAYAKQIGYCLLSIFLYRSMKCSLGLIGTHFSLPSP